MMAYRSALATIFIPCILVLALVEAVPPMSPRGRLPFLSARQSGLESCRICLATCAPTSVSSGWLTECETLRKNLRKIKRRDANVNGLRRGGFRDGLLFYCFLNYCRSFKVDEYCGLHPKGKNLRSLAFLNSEIALLKKQRQGLEARWKREAVPRFDHADYGARRDEAQDLQQKARKNLLVALNSRAQNVKLKAKLKTLDYRKQKYETRSLLNEIDFFSVYRDYWTSLENNYVKALETSAKSVRLIKEQVESDGNKMFREVDKTRNFEYAIGDENKQLAVLESLQTTLERRLRNADDLTARADSDYDLFRSIGGKISGLLDAMTTKIKAGTLDVGCTTDELAFAIAQHTTG